MGVLMSLVRKSEPTRTPIKGVLPRIKNIALVHFRGILSIIPVIILIVKHDKKRPSEQVKWIWLLIFWWFVTQPVNVPVTGLIPVFIFPLNAVLNSSDTCKCYFNLFTALLILGAMIHLLLNNSGADRRMALSIICAGKDTSFSEIGLMLKCSTAAYFMSILSNRLLVSSYLIQTVSDSLQAFQGASGKKKGNEPNFNLIKYIICNGIQISSALGGIVIIHGAFATMAFLSTWAGSTGQFSREVFNYLQYSCFAFPLTLVILIVVMIYHALVLKFGNKNKMGNVPMTEIKKKFMANKNALPPFSAHEKLTLFFLFFALALFFFRWSSWLNMGWSGFRQNMLFNQPYIYDATVAAIFVVSLHILPKGIGFLKVFKAKTKADLKNLKPESGIMWWKFMDKNINYGYMFLFGLGLALNTVVKSTGLSTEISDIGKKIVNLDYNIGILLVCLIATILPNMMSGVAACASFLPFVLNMTEQASNEWQTRTFIGGLAVGIASSFGYMCPFLYTPAYFCHSIGKVPKRAMAKYAIVPALLSALILWLFLILYAPLIFGKSLSIVVLTTTLATTTISTDETTEPAAAGARVII